MKQFKLNNKDTSQAPASPKSKSPAHTKSPARTKSPGSGRAKSPGSGRAKSPTASAPGSAKGSSRPGSKPVTPKATRNSLKTPPQKKTPAKGKPKGKDKDVSQVPSAMDDTEDEGLPEGVVPLFLTSKTQEIFSARCDEDVTKENPFKIIMKEDIIEDMRLRAAVSDFAPIKQDILNYPGDEILIVYDYDFKFEQNFYVAITEEAKEKLLNPPKEDEDEEEQEEEEVIYKYVPPVSKPWISQGSEKEIEEATVKETRRRKKVSIKRQRREFGAPYSFKDRNVADAKDGYVECTQYEDKNFNIKKMELDRGTQAIPVFLDAGTQTDWKYPRNACTQSYPRLFTDEEKETIEKSDTLINFVEEGIPRFQLALQQNEIMDVFYDDWGNLGDIDDFGSKADNHLKEYQSFTDLHFSKDKKITCIQWHPTIKGIVAVSVGERMNFDDRIDNAGKVIMTPSLILIWSFTDPIHPQLLLEAPDDIDSFQFNPSDPNIIVGGCYNGQLVLWDISEYADRLKAPRGGHRNKKKDVLPGFEDPNALKTPVIHYCAVSSIEFSHRAPITDIQWVPDHLEISKMGIPQENRSQYCVQIISAAKDHSVLFWDTRSQKPHMAKEEHAGVKHPSGIPNTFKHLDLTWKPQLKVYLHKSEPGGDHSPIVFSIGERQGDRKAAKATDDTADIEPTHTAGFSFSAMKIGSAKEKKTLHDVQTNFYVGTEDGEVVYLDWMPQKDPDTGKIQTPKPQYYHATHDGPVSVLQRSPFFKDVLLVIGGWTFSLWKEGVTSGPILTCAANPVKLTSGHWSPTRPGVFYVAKADGSIDIWDLLDKTHEPALTQSVSTASITTVYPFQVTHKQHLLAVGDTFGTLHILEIPWSLKHPTPNEYNSFANYIEREVKRRAFVVMRWDFREQEKRELESESKKKAGIAPNVVLSESEIENKLKLDYQDFLKEELAFLRELGLKTDDDVIADT
ncbi:dynein intermediate chain 3, axonemal-like isoform X2 [Gigantopelta aegis]|uniref:dynein intermediate chain 3, axonemal-like isoform X2 n=1 Tax=Gigantopelta aegis TaxID=1735272 RepID=UPI001B88D12B|nr:dynein intermediate chain 3, axonemal-like isoform X2 [Gigantopelta aegis]